MMPTITGPIHDSSGYPASGVLRLTASRAFEVTPALVTQAIRVVEVRDGEPLVGGEPWVIPVTPDGVTFTLVQDLDGEQTQTYTVIVPDVGQMTYTQLLYNRGQGVGGPGPFMWDLSEGDFPPEAVVGDWGIDLVPVDNKLNVYVNGAE